MSCQLLPTQMLPAGSMLMSTSICRPPPTKPPGGEIGSPIFLPGGQALAFAPQSCTMPNLSLGKLLTQTLSLPSMAIAHGPASPLPLMGEQECWLPSGRRTETLPPSKYPGCCLDMAVVRMGSELPCSCTVHSMRARTVAPRNELPRRLATQTLPWLSTAIPLTL